MMNGKLHGVHWFQWVGKLKWNDCKSQIWRNSCEDFHSPFCFTQIFCWVHFFQLHMFAKPPRLVSLPQPGLQMMWALLDAAIELVPAEHTRSFPESPLAVFPQGTNISPTWGSWENHLQKVPLKGEYMLVFSRVQVCGNVKLASSDLHMLQPIASWCPPDMFFLSLCFLPGKRLALWASLCFAIRLAVASKKMEETGEGWNGQSCRWNSLIFC